MPRWCWRASKKRRSAPCVKSGAVTNRRVPALPLLQLGIALKTMGDAPRGAEAMKLAVTTPRQDENRWLGDYGSHTSR